MHSTPMPYRPGSGDIIRFKDDMPRCGNGTDEPDTQCRCHMPDGVIWQKLMSEWGPHPVLDKALV